MLADCKVLLLTVCIHDTCYPPCPIFKEYERDKLLSHAVSTCPILLPLLMLLMKECANNLVLEKVGGKSLPSLGGNVN